MAELPSIITQENVTNEIITQLIVMPKIFTKSVKPVKKSNFFIDYKYLISSKDGEHEFSIIVNKHTVLPNKFSVILNYKMTNNKNGVNLFRCNSPHASIHTPMHSKFHTHTIIESD